MLYLQMHVAVSGQQLSVYIEMLWFLVFSATRSEFLTANIASEVFLFSDIFFQELSSLQGRRNVEVRKPTAVVRKDA